MIYKQDLQKLAALRLREAEALFDARMFDGCSYLCGYVVELALKASICKCLDVDEYPENEPNLKQFFRTHDFRSLELLSGLRQTIAAKRSSSPEFDSNWVLVTSWKSEDRYLVDHKTEMDARGMLDALRSSPEGVLTWLSQQW